MHIPASVPACAHATDFPLQSNFTRDPLCTVRVYISSIIFNDLALFELLYLLHPLTWLFIWTIVVLHIALRLSYYYIIFEGLSVLSNVSTTKQGMFTL